MAKIAIIGAGMMGSALAFPARENGNEVRLAGTHLDREIIEESVRTGQHPKFQTPFPEGIRFFQAERVRDAIEGCDFVICGVSSFGVDWFGREILPLIPPEMPVLSVTKGLIARPDGTLLNYPAYWSETYGGGHRISAIGGPCTSYELTVKDQTVVTFCGKNADDLAVMKGALETDYYHVNLSSDVVGIESAVALKNGFALGVAFSIGVNQRRFGETSQPHFNSQAGLFLEAAREMGALVRFLGGGRDAEYVGIGDLYVTIYGGRTRKLGVLLGRGLTADEAMRELSGVTLESAVVAKRVAGAVRALAERKALRLDDFPLVMHVDAVLRGESPVEIPWEKFV